MKEADLPDIPDDQVAQSIVHLNVDPHIVDRLKPAYNSIVRAGQVNKVSLIDLFESSDEEYLTGANNHFQGMARSRDGQYIFVSGGYKKASRSHLFVLEMNSYLPTKSPPTDVQKKRQFLSNNLYTSGPPSSDKGKKVFTIDKEYWHAGGISLMGDVLAVALENKNGSRIDLIDVSTPLSPKRIKTIIDRGALKSGSVSIIRLPNDHFLVGVWTEAGGHRFDFYLSESTSLISNYSGPVTVYFDDIEDRTAFENPRIQNFQFVKDKQGEFGIVGLYNSNIASQGEDKCYLLSMSLDQKTLRANPQLVKPKVKEESIISPRGNKKYYNFGHVGGVYVDGKNRLVIYGGGTKRKGDHKNNFAFVEFAPLMTGSDVLEEFEEGLVEIVGYKEPGANNKPVQYEIDRILKLDLTKHPRIDIYKDVEALGGHFNDRCGGVYWCLPTTGQVFFYEDSTKNTGDNGNSSNAHKKNRLALQGTGQIEYLMDLRNTPNNRLKYPTKRFWKKISSHSIS